MTHLHIPDGILPVWLWLSSIIAVVIYLFIFGMYLKNKPFHKKLALVGVFAALMIVAMSIEIPPFPYHVKLCSLTGIILGPMFSILTMFLVNIILALVGHGGITIVGLNTIILSLEAVIAYYCFKLLHKKFKSIFFTAFISTAFALFLATCVTIGVVYLGTNNINLLLHHHHHEIATDNIHNHHNIEHNNTSSEPAEEHSLNHGYFDITRFIMLVFGLSLIGWVLEGIITGFAIKYLYKIKPELLE